MKKIILSSILSLFLFSCAMPTPSAGPGFLFTSATEGIEAHNDVDIVKQGESCSHNILGIASVGDTSIENAKGSAGINNIATIDRTFFSILTLYANSCIVVKGN